MRVDSAGVDNAGLERLSRSECLALLASVPVGRIVYSDGALPAIQPVNFLLDEGNIVIRTGADTRLAAAARGTVVAFEVDEIDADSRGGWSVVVTGHARPVRDPDEVARLQRSGLRAWAPGNKEHFIRIGAELISGRRIIPGHLLQP